MSMIAKEKTTQHPPAINPPAIKLDEDYRFNLKLTKGAKEQLDGLVEKSGAATITEVVRRSIAVYDFLADHKDDRWELLLRDKKAGTEKVIKLL